MVVILPPVRARPHGGPAHDDSRRGRTLRAVGGTMAGVVPASHRGLARHVEYGAGPDSRRVFHHRVPGRALIHDVSRPLAAPRAFPARSRYNRVVRPIRGLALVASTWILSAAVMHPAAADAVRVETSARAMQPGELVVFDITAPPESASVSVSASGTVIPALRTASGSWRALVGLESRDRPGTARDNGDRTRARRHRDHRPPTHRACQEISHAPFDGQSGARQSTGQRARADQTGNRSNQ